MMTLRPYSTMKNALSTGLIIALLGTTVGCTVVTSGYDNQPVYRDSSFNRISQQLRQDLRHNGYEVIDIKADEYRNRQILIVYAKKNNQLYELKYTYPDLKRISSIKKDWSNSWQEKVENEARYPEIRQRAIRKITAMGYRVKDIELKKQGNREVFEIEAKRGSQEYNILLGYPNLNVIKVKKD